MSSFSRFARRMVLGPMLERERVPQKFTNTAVFQEPAISLGAEETVGEDKSNIDLPDAAVQLAWHNQAQTIAKPYYYIARDVVVYRDAVLRKEGQQKFILEALPGSPFQIGSLSKQVRGRDYLKCYFAGLSGTRKMQQLDNAYVFAHAYWSNYYHFIFDSLVKHELMLKASDQLGFTPTLLASRKPNKWQGQYLELIGVGQDELLGTFDKPVFAKNLLVVSAPRQRFHVSPRSVKSFASRVLSRLGLDNEQSTQKLYISRRNASSRRIANEGEVEQVLVEHGFRMICLEDLPVAEQISLFAKASTVVAPHGAGLTNLIYSGDVRLIELLPGDSWYLGHYLCLSASIGKKYTCVIGKIGPGGFMIDVASLVKAIHQCH